MVYRVGEMILQKTQEIFQGKVNDVIVCQDISNGGKLYYTVLVVHDRNIAKILMKLFHSGEKTERNRFIMDFTWKESYFMVFKYEKERLLERFFHTEVSKLSECEQLGLNLITECLACKMPYPILYLQLKQRQIHISEKKSIYMGMALDLSELDESVTEKECATLCARIIHDYIEEIKPGKSISGKLLEKKLWKGSYRQLMVLYKDLQMAAKPVKKETLGSKVKKIFRKKQDIMFKVLMVICVLAGVLAVLMIVSQLIFSDIPFLDFL